MAVLPFKPNHHTHERKRQQREATRQRLIQHIGYKLEDAPLFEEELRFFAYVMSLNDEK